MSELANLERALARTLQGQSGQLQIVLVGPQGSGKSALLGALTKAGYTLSEERTLPDNAVAVTVERYPR